MTQLSIPGMPSNAGQTNLERLSKRAAFGPVCFPEYFCIDEASLQSIDKEALNFSDTKVLKRELYKKTDQSMKSPDRSVGWVALSSPEFTAVVEYPEKLASRVEVKNDTCLPALFRSDEDRLAANRRAGAHVLEKRLPAMENLMQGYKYRMEKLRGLLGIIDYHWHARHKGDEVREMATIAREGLRSSIEIISDTKGWSETDKNEVLLGLDYRLLEGKGEPRLNEKKEFWKNGVIFLGNYQRDKHIIVRDRVLRSKFEIQKRLK